MIDYINNFLSSIDLEALLQTALEPFFARKVIFEPTQRRAQILSEEAAFDMVNEDANFV